MEFQNEYLDLARVSMEKMYYRNQGPKTSIGHAGIRTPCHLYNTFQLSISTLYMTTLCTEQTTDIYHIDGAVK